MWLATNGMVHHLLLPGVWGGEALVKTWLRAEERGRAASRGFRQCTDLYGSYASLLIWIINRFCGSSTDSGDQPLRIWLAPDLLNFKKLIKFFFTSDLWCTPLKFSRWTNNLFSEYVHSHDERGEILLRETQEFWVSEARVHAKLNKYKMISDKRPCSTFASQDSWICFFPL